MVRRSNRSLGGFKRRDESLVTFRPSQLTENFLRLPIGDKLVNFGFADRRYFYDIYDEDHPNQLLMCGRQVGKSTNIANKILAYSLLVNYFRSLYVSPTQSQTSDFSKARLATTIQYSPILRHMENRRKVHKITHKAFHNESEIILGYAYQNADRIRGKTADLNCIDEVQDILSTLIPIIEETMFTSRYKIKIYAGTPKSTANTIHHLWQQSTQNEWLVPCDKCGSAVEGGAGRTWNILGEKNIGKKGPICGRCGGALDPCHPEARWYSKNPNPRGPKGEGIKIPFHGYHISQLMHPMSPADWLSLLDKYSRYPRAQFFNEVLGMSYDSGLRPLNPSHIEACCDSTMSMSKNGVPDEGATRGLDYWRKYTRGNHPCFMGIDWGTSENTYTVITIGTYDTDGRFAVFYANRCTGPAAEPDYQLALIESLVEHFQPEFIGTDYGGGFYMNDQLVRRFGHTRVAKYQYTGIKDKVTWVPRLGRWEANRTEVMSDTFNAIRKGRTFKFPRWKEFEQPYAQDMLNIFGEYNHLTDTTKYDVSPGDTDDTFHSLLYCFLASQLSKPRHDVMFPVKEKDYSLS